MVLVCLCSCEANLFGPESREIAGGYRLKRADNPHEFALTIPNEDGGLIIDEIGWREPLIFARALGSQYWDVINTARAQHIRVSELDFEGTSFQRFYRIKICLAGIKLVLAEGGSRVVNHNGSDWLLADVDEVHLHNMRAATGGYKSGHCQ